MSDRTALDRFLQTDPRDVGCEQAMQILHVYVEMVAGGGDAEERFPVWRPILRHAGRAMRTSMVYSPRSAPRLKRLVSVSIR